MFGCAVVDAKTVKPVTADDHDCRVSQTPSFEAMAISDEETVGCPATARVEIERLRYVPIGVETFDTKDKTVLWGDQ